MDERIQKERKLWDRIARKYDKQTRMYEKTYALGIQKVLNVIKENQCVLEIACGTGTISLGISSAVNKIEAVDISSEMINIAIHKASQAGITNIHFSVADAYHLDYSDGFFDVILLFNVLHIVKNPDELLAEANRLLKSGGKLLTATDCYNEPCSVLVKISMLLQKLFRGLGYIPFLSFYRKIDIDANLEKYHLTIIDRDILYPNPVNYYAAAEKV